MLLTQMLCKSIKTSFIGQLLKTKTTFGENRHNFLIKSKRTNKLPGKASNTTLPTPPNPSHSFKIRRAADRRLSDSVIGQSQQAPSRAHPRRRVQPRASGAQNRALRSGRFQVGHSEGGSGPVREDRGALCAEGLAFWPRLLGEARFRGTAWTDLCLEPIPARGVCCESRASPPARSWSHFPERKSACGSGPGGTCSEEWRRRVRRCAWFDNGVPGTARLGEWAVARGRLVLATREPAGRVPLPLWDRGMGLGSLGVGCLTEGCPAGGTASERRRRWGWVRRGSAGPPEAQPDTTAADNPGSGFAHSFDSRGHPGQAA